MGCIGLSSTPVKKEMTLVLLGIAGSGKTTFSKQMQIIHNGKFEPTEEEKYRRIIMSNILFGIKQLIDDAEEDISDENKKKARYLKGVDENDVMEWNDDFTERVKSLWADDAIQNAWIKRKESILLQLDYLMSNFDRFLAENFKPNNDDILRARQRSTGENASSFEDKDRIWNMIDVGGQPSERSKWESILEKPINACLFFIALDEFDVPNAEAKTQETAPTKLALAISIFENVINGDFIKEHKSGRIVFLNKVDLFTSKIENSEKFAEFKNRLEYSGSSDVSECTQFIEKILRNKMNDDLPLHVHVVCALDTTLMKKSDA